MGTLNIDAFRDSGLTGYVMLRDIASGDGSVASEVVSTEGRIDSLKDRWFNTESRQRMSFDVLSALHRSLTESVNAEAAFHAIQTVFGQRVAEQVESHEFRQIGQDYQRVTAEQIREVLNQADREAGQVPKVKAALTYDAKGVTCRINGGDPMRLTDSNEANHRLISAGRALHRADKLLASDPSKAGDAEAVQAKIDGLIVDLQDAQTNLATDDLDAMSTQGAMVMRMKEDIAATIADLNELRTEYDALILHPVDSNAAQECLALWKAAGEGMIEGYHDAKGVPLGEDAKNAVKERLAQWIGGRLQLDLKGAVDLKATFGNLKEDLVRFLKGQFKEQGLELKKKFTKELSSHFENVMNRQQTWDPIRKTFSVEIGEGGAENGERMEVTSEITPARHIPHADVSLGYGGLNGVMCYSTKSPHCPNLAQTQLKADGKEVFNAVRHGVLSASGLKGNAHAEGAESLAEEAVPADQPGQADENAHDVHAPAEDAPTAPPQGDEPAITSRAEANKARGEDVVKAAFFAKVNGAGDEALAQIVANAKNDPDYVFDLNMTSVSLLTSVDIPFVCKEGKMGKEQEAVWADINQREQFAIKVADGDGGEVEVKVKPRVIGFTLSGNPPAVSLTPWTKGVGMMWGNVEKQNKTAYSAFMGRIDDFLSQNARSADPEVQKKCKYVSILRSQLRTIWDSESYQREAGGAYKASSRVAVITYLMGDIPCWNCKSGKDRTSMLDVESKFLALLVEKGRDIPSPDAKLSRAENRLYRTILFNSGSRELQKYNTGLVGTKALGGADTVKARLGVWFKAAQGASSYVKS